MALTDSGILTRNRLHPLQLGLFIACGSILMMFAALTSAYLVRQAAGNWLEFPLPSLFYVSAGVLLASSVTFQLATRAQRNWNTPLHRLLVGLTLALGLAFVLLQYAAWQTMFEDMGLPLTGNPAPSFVYVLSGLHAAHVLGGLVGLAVVTIHAFRFPAVPTPSRTLRVRLALTYWHFMDFLWIYLLVFLALQR